MKVSAILEKAYTIPVRDPSRPGDSSGSLREELCRLNRALEAALENPTIEDILQPAQNAWTQQKNHDGQPSGVALTRNFPHEGDRAMPDASEELQCTATLQALHRQLDHVRHPTLNAAHQPRRIEEQLQRAKDQGSVEESLGQDVCHHSI